MRRSACWSGAGANCMSYSVQSQFLPNWFVRRRALAIGIAFSGVGVGAILILPWLQTIILQEGWRSACWALGADDPVRAAADQPAGQPSARRISACCPTARRNAGVAAARRAADIVDAALGRDRMDGRRAPSARAASGGSASASSAAAMPGTRCRSTRRSTWSRSASARCRRPGRSASWRWSAFRARSCSARCPTGSAARSSGRFAATGFAICYAALLVLAAAPSQPLL